MLCDIESLMEKLKYEVAKYMKGEQLGMDLYVPFKIYILGTIFVCT